MSQTEPPHPFRSLPLESQLLLVRHGTAEFSRRTALLADADFDHRTLVPRWHVAQLVAHVGYNASALCRLLSWAAGGVETPMYASTEQRRHEIDEGATLPPAALRKLVDHTIARLDKAWRDLDRNRWSSSVRTAQGRLVPATETVWLRAREVWVHAVDLDNGAEFSQFPAPVLDGLLEDVLTTWRARGVGSDITLQPEPRTGPITFHTNMLGSTVVAGPLAGLVRWACGRGTPGAGNDQSGHAAPPWL